MLLRTYLLRSGSRQGGQGGQRGRGFAHPQGDCLPQPPQEGGPGGGIGAGGGQALNPSLVRVKVFVRTIPIKIPNIRAIPTWIGASFIYK